MSPGPELMATTTSRKSGHEGPQNVRLISKRALSRIGKQFNHYRFELVIVGYLEY